MYSRWANRTVDAFAAAVADLEGAAAATAFASGMAAVSGVFLGLCSAGDRIVAARQLYGGTFSVLSQLLPRFGIETVLIDQDDLEGWDSAAPGARLLYCETIANPAVTVPDLPAIAAVADRHSLPLVVDNTFASPVLCRPLEHGAALVLHSATKFLGGHHDLIGGVVCGRIDVVDQIRAVARETGPTLSPFNAWLALRGIATLPLRVERSSSTALELARWLAGRDEVERVMYPSLEGDQGAERAHRLLGGRGGGIIGFDVAGGKGAATRVQDALRLIRPAASLGGTHSLIVHAASVTHTQLSTDELVAAGIAPGFCRLSVGLEDPADLIADLERALARAA